MGAFKGARMRFSARFGLGALALGGIAGLGACAQGIDPPAPTPAVKIAGGVFTMGGDSFDPCGKASVARTGTFTMSCKADQQSEALAHPVEVKDFYLDETEVTVEQYRHCVELDDCTRPDATEAGVGEGRIRDYYGSTKFNDHPVLGTNHAQAAAFCALRGGRLPTEAEWEFAATSRGERATVWELSAAAENCEQASGTIAFGKCSANQVRAVGASADDTTSQGLRDMGANAMEWVSDEYDHLAYCAQQQPDGNLDALYGVGSERGFPQPKSGAVPAGLLASTDSAACLDVTEPPDNGKYSGGCDDRQDYCIQSVCASAFSTDNADKTQEFKQRAWAGLLCDQLKGALPNGTATCDKGAESVCANLADADLEACQERCACEGTLLQPDDAPPTDAPTCINRCLSDYRACTTEGVAAGLEPERAACLKADVGLACYDTEPGAGNGRLRVRPLCLLRGSAGTPFAAHDGQRNVPHESGISSGDLAGGFVARGAHFQETEACETRPTRRRVIKKGFVSAQVGFRCAYDRDPGAGQ